MEKAPGCTSRHLPAQKTKRQPEPGRIHPPNVLQERAGSSGSCLNAKKHPGHDEQTIRDASEGAAKAKYHSG